MHLRKGYFCGFRNGARVIKRIALITFAVPMHTSNVTSGGRGRKARGNASKHKIILLIHTTRQYGAAEVDTRVAFIELLEKNPSTGMHFK